MSKYKHIKTGGVYTIVNPSCKIQIEGVWVEAIVYADEHNMWYVRTKEEFNEKFVRVSEYEEIRKMNKEILNKHNKTKSYCKFN